MTIIRSSLARLLACWRVKKSMGKLLERRGGRRRILCAGSLLTIDDMALGAIWQMKEAGSNQLKYF